MTDHDSIELARRAVASKHWRWLPGMRYCEPYRVPAWSEEPRFLRMVDGHEDPPADAEARTQAQYSGCVPDLTDAATLGCLLQLVREAWGCDEWRRVTIEPAGAGWCVVVRNGRHRPPSRSTPGWDLDRHAHPRYRDVSSPLGSNEFTSESEALVAALLAAPAQHHGPH
jgi:hypothetical protein